MSADQDPSSAAGRAPAPTADNRAQIDYWNGQAGETWVRRIDRIDGMLAPITQALLERAAVRPGERVIDVGCGCGSTSLELVRRGARVFGVDVSEPMLALAKQRAAGLEGIAFKRADAAVQPLTPDHELVFSRFGVMFFADPVAAFRNLRTGLTPEGRLCFVCWQAMSDNAWMATAGQAVMAFLPKPAEAPDPRAPGPFAFADRDHLHGILARAGFESIGIEDFRTKLHVGDDLDQAMAFQSDVGPVARALAELEGETRDRALAAAREALAKHLTPSGVDLGAACWLVTARPGGRSTEG
ncbi:MAG: class I SAM-dependent methyltransferase [Myxococcota bacterium]